MTNWLERAQTVFRKSPESGSSIPEDARRTKEKRSDSELPIPPESANAICSDSDCWTPTAIAAERRFGQRHARLFAFLGRKVRTPGGPGTLLQVSADRVTVLLDSDLGKCAFFSPDQITRIAMIGDD
jgi:hypothetical protein